MTTLIIVCIVAASAAAMLHLAVCMDSTRAQPVQCAGASHRPSDARPPRSTPAHTAADLDELSDRAFIFLAPRDRFGGVDHTGGGVDLEQKLYLVDGGDVKEATLGEIAADHAAEWTAPEGIRPITDCDGRWLTDRGERVVEFDSAEEAIRARDICWLYDLEHCDYAPLAFERSVDAEEYAKVSP